MRWCPTCATYRSDPCPVCRLRARLERVQDENLRAYRALPWELRIKRKEDESNERETAEPYPIKGTDEEREDWLVHDLAREIERVRRDTNRMKKARKECLHQKNI